MSDFERRPGDTEPGTETPSWRQTETDQAPMNEPSSVGVYDRPETTTRGGSSALWTTILVLAVLALLAYLLFQFVF